MVVTVFVSHRLRPMPSRQSREELLAVTGLVADGKLTPVIGQTRPLAEVADGLRTVEEGHSPRRGRTRASHAWPRLGDRVPRRFGVRAQLRPATSTGQPGSGKGAGHDRRHREGDDDTGDVPCAFDLGLRRECSPAKGRTAARRTRRAHRGDQSRAGCGTSAHGSRNSTSA